jgi:ribonuclease E
MAGLIVIDFIDMESNGHIRKVEKAMKEALKNDRARIQVGRISSFGLMEMSRQRLRTGVLEASTRPCPHCEGTGLMRTASSAGLSALRMLEDEAARGRGSRLILRAGREAAIYLLNRKRDEIIDVERRYGVAIEVLIEEDFEGARMAVESLGPPPAERPRPAPIAPVEADEEDEVEDALEDEAFDEDEEEEEPAGKREGRGERSERGDARRRRRRRGRRGGRRREREGDEPLSEEGAEAEEAPAEVPPAETEAEAVAEAEAPAESEAAPEVEPAKKGRRRPRARKRDEAQAAGKAAEAAPEVAPEASAEAAAEPEATAPKAKAPRARRSRRKAAEPAPADAAPTAANDSAPESAPAGPSRDSEPVDAEGGEEGPDGEPRRGWWQRTFGA